MVEEPEGQAANWLQSLAAGEARLTMRLRPEPFILCR